MTYRIIIAGSRNFHNYNIVEGICNKIIAELLQKDCNRTFVIVSGHAKGGDMLGEEYAQRHGLPIELYPANWARDGRAAGIIRNRKMAEVADELIAFWDGTSNGTANMIGIAKSRNMRCTVVKVEINEWWKKS